jgi:Uncharacterised nucleotidyltransferase
MDSRPAIRSWLETLRLSSGFSTTPPSVAELDTVLPLAKFEEIIPWYWHRLRAIDALPALSAERQSALRQVSLASATHRLKNEAGTAQAVARLNDHGIPVVLLKGIAYAALQGAHPYLTHRQTGDADILVPPDQAERAWQLLLANGFRRMSEADSIHPDHHHLPTLVGPSGFHIEVHVSASFFLTPDVSWQRFGDAAHAVQWRGVSVYIPPATELLWHAAAHSLGDGAAGCRLRHLLTAASLMSDPAIDWDILAARFLTLPLRNHDSRRPIPSSGIRRWLTAAAWFADAALPKGLTSPEDPLRIMSALLAYTRPYLGDALGRPRHVTAMPRPLEEAAAAAFGLGIHDGGHWLTHHQRARRLLSSAWYQLRYRSTSGSA